MMDESSYHLFLCDHIVRKQQEQGVVFTENAAARIFEDAREIFAGLAWNSLNEHAISPLTAIVEKYILHKPQQVNSLQPAP